TTMFLKSSFFRRNWKVESEFGPIGDCESGGEKWYCERKGAANGRRGAGFSGELKERPLPDSNRGWRICNPLPYHLAKGPSALKSAGDFIGNSSGQQELKALQALAQGVDAAAALLVGGGVTVRRDLARLHVVKHHLLGGDELGTGLGRGRGDGERDRRDAVAVAV